jgi:hypothetical protein
MDVLRVAGIPIEQDYERNRQAWLAAADAQIELDPAMSDREANQWIAFLKKRLGDGFADSLLFSVTELDVVTDEDVLLEILSFADKSARTAVCLKDGLSHELRRRCLADSDDDVRTHFIRRHKVS